MTAIATTASSPCPKWISSSKPSANAGAKAGLYGAKITGGGTGGTVAVFGKLEALHEHIPQIATEYSRRVGVMPDIFEGTSPGAMEFGGKRYTFGANGWNRQGVSVRSTRRSAAGVPSLQKRFSSSVRATSARARRHPFSMNARGYAAPALYSRARSCD